jgi:predicted ATPase
MLTQIELRNFKSIKELILPIGPLTVLTGLNGSGKSSILQAIGLIAQSTTVDELRIPKIPNLILKGPWVQIGHGEDLLLENSTTDEVSIFLKTNLLNGTGYYKWQGQISPQEDVIRQSGSVDGITLDNKDLFGNTHLFRRFQFIQADRLVPALQYPQTDSVNRGEGCLGKRGEWTVDYLARHADDKVSKKRLFPVDSLTTQQDKDFMHSMAPTESLIDVTTAWLQKISPGVRPVANLLNQDDAVSLRFRYEGNTTSLAKTVSREHRAGNVGFGLTYCLPIIVACLSSPPGALVLLENPEAHLHPRGQFQMGVLLAMCANDGVQFIVETHSDHLLNGIRVATKKGFILSENIQVHYFDRSKETGLSTCVSPRLMRNGRFDDWPEGFFDEWDNALDQLLED